MEKTVSTVLRENGKEPSLGIPHAKKLTDWKMEPEVRDLKQDLEAAQHAHDEMIHRIRRWMNLRNCTGPEAPPKIKGRSRAQPQVIRRNAEWRYSALSEPFNSTPDLFRAEPVSFEDEESAKQNEILLNHQFRTKLNKVKFIDEYIRTAVDEGLVITRTGWKRITRMKKVEVPVWEYVEPQTEEELAALEQALMLKADNPAEFEELPAELQEAVAYTMENQTPVVAIMVDTEEVEEEEVLINEPTIDVIDPENFYPDPSCLGQIKKAGFVVYSFETSKAELMKDGRYKNLNAVNWSGNEILAQPDHQTSTPNSFNFNDDLRRRIVAYEYWGYRDVNGDETLTPILATWVGDVMIRMEENPFPDEEPPFVLTPYLPVRRAIHGEPDAELLADNQRIIGAVTRGMIDLMGRSANSQQGMAKGFLDVVNRRRFEQGLDYEFNPTQGDPRLSVYQHAYPEIPNSAMNMIQMQNLEAEAISGVKAFSGGLSGEGYGQVAAGIKGMLDAAAKREMNILRRLAQGIIEIGHKIAAMNAAFLSEEEVVRVTNKEFVKIRRDSLAGKFDLILDIATPEIDEARSQDLAFMLQTMGPDMDPALSRMILAEIADLKRQKGLAEKIRRFQPQPDPLAEELKKLELEKLKMEIAKLQSEVARNQALAERDKSQADLNTLEFVEQESGTQHARDLAKQSEQAQANQDLEVTKALLRPLKVDERRPDIESAVGFNRISDVMKRVAG